MEEGDLLTQGELVEHISTLYIVQGINYPVSLSEEIIYVFGGDLSGYRYDLGQMKRSRGKFRKTKRPPPDRLSWKRGQKRLG